MFYFPKNLFNFRKPLNYHIAVSAYAIPYSISYTPSFGLTLNYVQTKYTIIRIIILTIKLSNTLIRNE